MLELFSGLGGWSYALGGRGAVVAAYDIKHHANATYRLNHGAGAPGPGDRPGAGPDLRGPRRRHLADEPALPAVLPHGQGGGPWRPAQLGLPAPAGRAPGSAAGAPGPGERAGLPGLHRPSSCWRHGWRSLGFRIRRTSSAPAASASPTSAPGCSCWPPAGRWPRREPPDLAPGPLAPFLDLRGGSGPVPGSGHPGPAPARGWTWSRPIPGAAPASSAATASASWAAAPS